MSLPDVLRLVPGVHVAQIDAARYAIGIRGFADRLARSMLVLVDGRAVYSPLFAGTYWEVQDVLLEDIDRIEIIRGPGVRAMWTISSASSLFGAVTRAVRTPSRVETDYTTTSLVSPALPTFVRLQPNAGFAPKSSRRTSWVTGLGPSSGCTSRRPPSSTSSRTR